MSLFGVHLTMLIGPAVPVPAPVSVLDAVDTIEVTHSDEERSGFQIVFRAGRGPLAPMDYPLLSNPLLTPGNRLILTVAFGPNPEVLFDGIILQQQLDPGQNPGEATFTITGEDVSAAMDRVEKVVEHPAQPETVIALKIIGSYAQYGLVPQVIPPPSLEAPLPVDRTPVQRETDLGYLIEMAERYAYVFFVAPGPAPGMNRAYWGPPPRVGALQPAISVNMGADTNVSSVDFQNDAADAANVEGTVQDRQTNTAVPVRTVASTQPPLAAAPGLQNPAVAGTRAYQAGGGRSATQAYAEAQAETEASAKVVKVEGEIADVGRYGTLLKARGTVGVRGAGFSYDGLYYVNSVTSTVTREGFSQKFSATREGTGSTVPVVRI